MSTLMQKAFDNFIIMLYNEIEVQNQGGKYIEKTLYKTNCNICKLALRGGCGYFCDKFI